MIDAISRLVELAETEGLRGELTHWSEADVWWFDDQMPARVRDAGNADPALRFFETEATPHDRADVGFKDDEKRIAISFARNN